MKGVRIIAALLLTPFLAVAMIILAILSLPFMLAAISVVMLFGDDELGDSLFEHAPLIYTLNRLMP